MDADGYICLTDYGLATIVKDGEEESGCAGTPEYMAPEMIKNAGYSYPADWWTLGILTYEMVVGNTPFYTGGRNMHKLEKQIQTKPVLFPDEQRHKIAISEDCKDFILKLLDKDPAARLGSKGGLDEILAHPWLMHEDADGYMYKQIKPPYLPKIENPNQETI